MAKNILVVKRERTHQSIPISQASVAAAGKPTRPENEEIELKLALPTSDPTKLAQRLARTPALAQGKPKHLHLVNIYYDTPEQLLRQRRICLRLRRVDSVTKPKWMQTLKTGGALDSALSQRGQWEHGVRGAALSWPALQATPWSVFDPEGNVFQTLTSVFVTTFDRTLWRLHSTHDSTVEAALDIGQIVVGARREPICELELELKTGSSAVLFDIGQDIAKTIAVLPLKLSKAERGYALMDSANTSALCAQPSALNSTLTLGAIAQQLLSEMFCQFTSNLNALRVVDDPEITHQARVGWRRFKSTWRLFKPILKKEKLPSQDALHALLTGLGKLRDLDVAATQTLPAFATSYTAFHPDRLVLWQTMTSLIRQAAQRQRKSVRAALAQPALGAALLATTRWLVNLPSGVDTAAARPQSSQSQRHWLEHRISRLHQQLKSASKKNAAPADQHRLRILAKRLRYSIEAVGTLLPKSRRQHWSQQATQLQTGIGAKRDLLQAAALAAELGVDSELVAFLRQCALSLKG